MFQYLHLFFLVTLCHCQDLDAIMTHFSEFPTETGASQTEGVTATINYDVTQAVDYDATETAPVQPAADDQVETEAQSSRRKRQDEAPENTAAVTDAGEDFGGDLDSLIAHIEESQATEPVSETTEPIDVTESRRK